jgi:hypothetical protein
MTKLRKNEDGDIFRMKKVSGLEKNMEKVTCSYGGKEGEREAE